MATSRRFPWLVGIELECFSKDVISDQQFTKLNGLVNNVGCLTRELGIRQNELVTNPYYVEKVQSTVHLLEKLIECLPEDLDLSFCAKDPKYVEGLPTNWVETPRYNAMLNALAREKPNDWKTVFEISKWCAAHINIGISPWSVEGLFIMNIINNVGPYIASLTRKDFPESRGHLTVWTKWADKNRLPSYSKQLYSSMEEFGFDFKGTKKLIKKINGSEYEVDLAETRSIHNPIDLGTHWIFCRPKISIKGEWYLEIRLLPSMSLEPLEFYVEEMLKGIEAISNWSNEASNNNIISSNVSRAVDAASKKSKIFPPNLLSEEEWNTCFVQ